MCCVWLVDAMGGDYAPAEIVKGVISAVNRMEELEFTCWLTVMQSTESAWARNNLLA